MLAIVRAVLRCFCSLGLDLQNKTIADFKNVCLHNHRELVSLILCLGIAL